MLVICSVRRSSPSKAFCLQVASSPSGQGQRVLPCTGQCFHTRTRQRRAKPAQLELHAPPRTRAAFPKECAALEAAAKQGPEHPVVLLQGVWCRGEAGEGRTTSKVGQSKPRICVCVNSFSVRVETSAKWGELTAGYLHLLPGHRKVFPKTPRFPESSLRDSPSWRCEPSSEYFFQVKT